MYTEKLINDILNCYLQLTANNIKIYYAFKNENKRAENFHKLKKLCISVALLPLCYAVL